MRKQYYNKLCKMTIVIIIAYLSLLQSRIIASDFNNIITDYPVEYLMIFIIIITGIAITLLIKTRHELKRIRTEKIELSLKDSETSISLDSGDVGVVKYDIIKEKYYRDYKFYKHLGYSEDEIIAFDNNKFQILYEDDIELIKQYNNQLVLNPQDTNYKIKIRIYRKDRSLATVLLLGKITQYSTDGKPEIMHGVIVDISNTDRLYFERNKLEEFLELALGEYGVSTWEWSKESDIIEYQFFSKNNKFYPLSRKYEIDSNGRLRINLKEYITLVHPDDVENLKRFSNNYKMAKTEEDIKIIHNQHRLIINNIVYTIYVRGKIIEYGKDGFTSKVLGIAHNITDRINQDESKAQSRKLEAIGSLASGIAHDFNNQLNGILGFVDLLERSEDLKDNNNAQRYLKIIKECGDKCEELTSQLLTFAQRGKEKQEVFNLDLLINNTVKMLEHTFDRGIEISTKFNAFNHIIEADKSQIENALVNIILNACDAIENEGRILIETDDNIGKYSKSIHTFERFKGKDVIIVKIEDNGVGIKPDIITKIFEPFFTTKKIGRATGMGLSVAFGIIKEHDGEIHIESSMGVGTTVYICLPVKTDNTVIDINKDEMDDQDYNKKLFGKILVVDDEAPVRLILKKYLTSFGCEVVLAENGVEAVNKYKLLKDEITLVISDISMPKMNGPETLKQLKRINDDVKVILITGYTEYEDKVIYMLKNGASALLKKPLNRDKLYKGIRKALG